MNILFLTSDASPMAGVGPCLVDLLGGMDRATWQGAVVCPWEAHAEASLSATIEMLGYPCFTRDMGRWMVHPRVSRVSGIAALMRGARSRLWALMRLVEEYRVDVVYSNGLPVIDGALVAKLANKKHVWHLHEAIRNNEDLKGILPAGILARTVGYLSDRVIVNSDYLAKEMAAVGNEKIRVVHNGIEMAEWERGASQVVGLPGLAVEEGKQIVLSVGTVAPRKGYDTLVDAAEIVARRCPNVVFWVAGAIGDEAYHSRLTRKIAEKRLTEIVRFLGPRNDVAELMKVATLFLHTAKQETFGRVIVEAMAAQLPVVSTRCGGPQEIIVEGETGTLVDVGDSTALASAVGELLLAPARRKEYAERGYQEARSRFSREAYVQGVSRVLNELMVAEN